MISSIAAGRQRDIAAHVRSFLVSRQDGFQPTQMLTSAETDLSGNLEHLDLPGVIQMLGQARQTGALHINASDTGRHHLFRSRTRSFTRNATCYSAMKP